MADPTLAHVHMHADAYAGLCEHACRDPSRECVGVLGANPSGAIVVAWPLDTGTPDAVSIRRSEIARATAALRDGGLVIAGTYHSHLRTAAVPSEVDRLSMRPGELLVIVALPSLDARAYVLDDEHRHAVPILLELVSGPA